MCCVRSTEEKPCFTFRYIAPRVGFPQDGNRGHHAGSPIRRNRSANRGLQRRLSSSGSKFEEVDVLPGVS